MSKRAMAIAVAAAVSAVLALGACSSNGSGGSSPGSIERSTTTSTTAASSTSTTSRVTTTTKPSTNTTTDQGSTTTTGDAPTTTKPSTTTTSGASTTTTAAPSTTTTRPATTTSRPATTTSTATPTTTTGVVPAEVNSDSRKAPWLALGVLAALAVLIAVVVVRRRSERAAWWSSVDALGRETQALVDLGTAGPASTEPAPQVAHWATLEQRTEALVAGIRTATAGAPDDEARGVLSGLDGAVGSYLTALQTARTLRIGPPAPTAEQVQYADAESAQRLANVRGALGPLDTLVAPHR